MASLFCAWPETLARQAQTLLTSSFREGPYTRHSPRRTCRLSLEPLSPSRSSVLSPPAAMTSSGLPQLSAHATHLTAVSVLCTLTCRHVAWVAAYCQSWTPAESGISTCPSTIQD